MSKAWEPKCPAKWCVQCGAGIDGENSSAICADCSETEEAYSEWVPKQQD